MLLFCEHWFPGELKPALPGVYERRNRSGSRSFHYFNGTMWSTGFAEPERAARNRDPNWFDISSFQHREWRGWIDVPETTETFYDMANR